MAKHKGYMKGSPTYAKADGKQGLKAKNDYGAEKDFRATATPASVKGYLGAGSKYKHNEK